MAKKTETINLGPGKKIGPIQKGGLHKSLGVPEGQTIPKARVAAAAKQGGKVGKQARLAQTLGKMGKK